MNTTKRVYYLRTPKKLIHVYRVAAYSKEDALERVAYEGEQLSSENEMDVGPTDVTESNDLLADWD